MVGRRRGMAGPPVEPGTISPSALGNWGTDKLQGTSRENFDSETTSDHTKKTILRQISNELRKWLAVFFFFCAVNDDWAKPHDLNHCQSLPKLFPHHLPSHSSKVGSRSAGSPRVPRYREVRRFRPGLDYTVAARTANADSSEVPELEVPSWANNQVTSGNLKHY